MDRFSYGCKTFCLGVFFYCDIKIGLLTLLIGGVVQIGIRILKEWGEVGSGDSAEMIVMILGAVCMVVLISASLLRHLAWLQKRLRLQMSEYSNLINRISEGVLVLVREYSESADQSNKTKEIKFSNKSSDKIFSVADNLQGSTTSINLSDLAKPRFLA